MELYFAFVVFATSTTVTPGPNNIMIMVSGLHYGIHKSLPHLFGICFGFPAMVVLVGLGFSIVFEQWPLLHQVINLVGITYLLYLAWLMANATSASLEPKASKPLGFLQAVLFQWVNPKAWVMATGAISTFTSPTTSLPPQVVLISLTFFIVAFPCVGLWLLFGTSLQQWLTSVNHQKFFNLCMALLLVASMTPVIINCYTAFIG